VIDVPSVEVEAWQSQPSHYRYPDFNDEYVYFSNWLHGDIRQYDISHPATPGSQVRFVWWLAEQGWWEVHKLAGGPQMLQLSLDGKRLYVTNSLFSTWDNQFRNWLRPAPTCCRLTVILRTGLAMRTSMLTLARSQVHLRP